MRSDGAALGLDAVLEVLEMIWNPGMEARRLQKDLEVRSRDDTGAAAERAGYEVNYVDLPESVSGFATVIDGQPVIAVNRAKPLPHIQYTLSHELGHQVLHLSPSRQPDPLGILSNEDVKEFQAHMFAASWVLAMPDSEDKKQILEQNPEANMVTLAMFASFVVIVVALLAYLASPLFPTPPPQPQTLR